MRVDLDVAGIDHQPLVIRLIDESLQQFFPGALVAPPTKASVGVFPVPVVRRQIAPRGSGAQDPEDRIDKEPVVFGLSSPEAPLPGQMGFEEFPGSFRDVVAAVGGRGDGDSLGEVRGFSPI